MIRRVAAWMAALIVGVLLGLGSAWAALNFMAGQYQEHYGAWTFSRAAGSTAAGPYTRALIAQKGLLALNRSEALYFTIAEDEHGQPLDESCIYELSGRTPEARWWSVTLYARDNFLAQNNDHAASVDASRVLMDGDRFVVRVAPVRGEAANWVSSRSAGRGFSLTLRLYNPHREFQPSEQALPHLSTVTCAGAAP
ncbi:DUF1214 domain-containing protein [Terricaulis sp.]|uniref:DUF1214 domain-containing protein n=1 Tax=Terricaulis sp. TaxID=2768686 RepID=UPI00378354A5